MPEMLERECKIAVDPQHYRRVGRQIDRSPHSKDLRQKMRGVRGRVPDFSEMRRGYDIQMEETQRRDEGILHCWPGQCHRVGSDDSDWAEQHRGGYCVEMEAVFLVYVTPCELMGEPSIEPATEVALRVTLKLFILV